MKTDERLARLEAQLRTRGCDDCINRSPRLMIAFDDDEPVDLPPAHCPTCGRPVPPTIVIRFPERPDGPQ